MREDDEAKACSGKEAFEMTLKEGIMGVYIDIDIPASHTEPPTSNSSAVR